jgi:hypothetical protein
MDGIRRPETTLSLFLLRTAFLPAFSVQKVAVTTLPGEFLATDLHVLREGSMRAVVVLFNGQILDDTEDDDGTTNEDRDLDPRPQLLPFLIEGLVGLGGHHFLLVGDPSPDLFNGLLLHVSLGTQPGNGLDGTAPRKGGSDPADRKVAGNVSSDERLLFRGGKKGR